jgi:hypothetical protein
MVVRVVSLRKHDLDRAAVKNDAARLTVASPGGKGPPSKCITIESYRAIEICGRDEQVVKAIF